MWKDVLKIKTIDFNRGEYSTMRFFVEIFDVPLKEAKELELSPYLVAAIDRGKLNEIDEYEFLELKLLADDGKYKELVNRLTEIIKGE